MKKFVLGLLCGTAIALSVAATVSTSIQAKLFPSKVMVHESGETYEIKVPPGHGVFNYKGSAYVPLRSLAEGIGGNVGYKSATAQTNNQHRIDIYLPEPAKWELSRAPMYSCSICDYEDGLTVIPAVGKGKGEFQVEINNYKSTGIVLDPIPLKFEIYNEEHTELLYSKTLPTFSGLLLGKHAYTISIHWDETDLAGNQVEKGLYFAELTRPGEVYYTLEDEKEKQVEIQQSAMGWNLPFFGFSIQ